MSQCCNLFPCCFNGLHFLPAIPRDKDATRGERHHRCLSEEARIHRTKILKANSRRAPCAGDLWDKLNDGSTHCQPPYYALGKLSQTVDTLVTVQFAFRNGYKPQRSISCPPSHETSPTTVCAEGSSASRMTFLSNRLVHRAKQPAPLAIAPRGAGPPAIEPL